MGGEKPGGAASNKPPQIKNLPERPKAPQTEAVAKTLTAPQSAEAKANAIIDELWKVALSNANGKGTSLFNRTNYQVNKLNEAFFATKAHMLQKIKGGAEFVGYADGGMVINWFRDGNLEKEINPAFLSSKMTEMLNERGKSILKQKREEVLAFNASMFAEAQAEGIVERLKQAGLIDKKLSAEKVKASEFWEELMEVLTGALKKMSPYSPDFNANGFVLINHFGKFKDEPFDMRRFDKNLNYPRETTEQKADRYIAEKILPFLRGVRPGLSDEKMLNSWLIQEEIKPVVFAGYKGGKPYEFVKEGANFRLKCKIEGFKDQVFNLGDYDEDLNLLKPKREPVTAAKETQAVKEGQKASGHHEDKEVFQIKTSLYAEAYNAAKDLRYAEHKPSVESVNKVIDQIVEANPEFFSPYFSDMKDLAKIFMDQLEAGKSAQEADDAMEAATPAGLIGAFENAGSSADKAAQAGFSVFNDLTKAIASHYETGEHGGNGGHGPNSGNEAHEGETKSIDDGQKTTVKSMK